MPTGGAPDRGCGYRRDRSYGAAGGQEVRIGSSTHHPTLRIKKMFKLDRTDTPAGGEHATVYLVFELSKKTWQLGLLRPGSDKLSRYSIAGGDLTALAWRAVGRRLRRAANRFGSCRATRPVWTGTGCIVG